MAVTKVRVPGGGNTFIVMGIGSGTRLAFLANFNDQPGRAVGNATPIHPVGSPYPVDIATPYAQGVGTLTLTVWSTWGNDGWVSAFANDTTGVASPWIGYKSASSGVNYPVDLREVFEAQRQIKDTNNQGYILTQKYEFGNDGKTIARVKNYHKCVITDIDASDNVSIETMEQRVRITCQYTYMSVTRNGKYNQSGLYVAEGAQDYWG